MFRLASLMCRQTGNCRSVRARGPIGRGESAANGSPRPALAGPGIEWQQLAGGRTKKCSVLPLAYFLPASRDGCRFSDGIRAKGSLPSLSRAELDRAP